MTDKERRALESDLELLKYLHQLHNEQEGNLSLTQDESVDHRLTIMEEIDRIMKQLKEDDHDKSTQ